MNYLNKLISVAIFTYCVEIKRNRVRLVYRIEKTLSKNIKQHTIFALHFFLSPNVLIQTFLSVYRVIIK